MKTSLFAGGGSGDLWGSMPVTSGVAKNTSNTEKKKIMCMKTPIVTIAHSFIVPPSSACTRSPVKFLELKKCVYPNQYRYCLCRSQKPMYR
ncbi:hypothetical protein DPMN_018200 [Dreissena polymorpha]|uniref:Uncharacterized protein n=1 Tax=Dreissena polymorpha TaxID=45954 RepID=A0A9D4S855_DREPO|nr:hypothetical protein DPMN_018200 [Dreissena polymorpha]